MRCFQGELLVLIQIEIVRLSKIIFVCQIEQGQSVFIPREISQDRLPVSFRYYDPVLRIIQSFCSSERKEYFSLKNEFNIHAIHQKNPKANFAKFMGFDKDKEKLS
jgi:hypothetical protein